MGEKHRVVFVVLKLVVAVVGEILLAGFVVDFL